MFSKETSPPQDYKDFFLLLSFKSLAVLGLHLGLWFILSEFLCIA